MTTPTDTKNQDAAELVGFDDPPEFYDDAQKIQKPYGLKRHDEICDHLEQVQRMSEADVVTASVGIWMGIESERQHKNKQLIALREENAKWFHEMGKMAGHYRARLDDAANELAVEREKSKKLVEALCWAKAEYWNRCYEGGTTKAVTLGEFDRHVDHVLAAHAESEARSSPAENNEKRGSSDDL